MTGGPGSDGSGGSGGSGDDDVPRLPRGRGLRLSRPELVRIALLALLLVFLVATQRQCASAVSRFVTGFGDRSSSPAGSSAPAVGPESPARNPDDYERLRPGMTDDEIKAAIERARARAGRGSAAESAPAGSAAEPAPTGSAAKP